MKNLLSLCAISLMLTGCALIPVHKIDIEQGNIMTPDMIRQVHVGMTEERVKDILGPPMLSNTFSSNRIDYVYTYKPGYGKMSETSLTLQFNRGILKDIQENHYVAKE